MSLWPSVISLASGLAAKEVYEQVRSHYRFKKELADNDNINVSGEDWFAAWQTRVEGHENLNTERLVIKQKGRFVRIRNVDRAAENPKGGYLWHAQLQFFQGRYLMGWYTALPQEHNSSKGTMFFSYVSPKKIFHGRWIGTAYDDELTGGYCVISKSRDSSSAELKQIINR